MPIFRGRDNTNSNLIEQLTLLPDSGVCAAKRIYYENEHLSSDITGELCNLFGSYILRALLNCIKLESAISEYSVMADGTRDILNVDQLCVNLYKVNTKHEVNKNVFGMYNLAGNPPIGETIS